MMSESVFFDNGKQTVLKEKTTEKTNKCPECGRGHLVRDYERGELVCEYCGAVVEEQIVDQGPDYRVFESGSGESRKHNGGPEDITKHDKGLTTEIAPKNKDCNGNSLSPTNRAMFYRLRKWQKRMRVSNGAERNMATAMMELDRIAATMVLSETVKGTAAMIYRRAVKKNLIRGRSIQGVVAASVYAACRQCGVPRTLDEISAACRVGRKEIGRTYRFMTRELKLKLLPTNPQDYVQRFCSELNLNGEVQNMTTQILRDAHEKEITSGKGPTGVAAAAIYISAIKCNKRRTQKDVADVAGVTEVTIRNRYKEIAEILGIEIQV